MEKLDIINSLEAELKRRLPMKQEDLNRLNKKFRLEFNYNSNHIEGNTLTYGETELLLIFDDTKGSHTMREYEEMKAHDVAYQLVEDWANDKEHPLTEQYIKNLNEIILVRPYWKDAITPDGQNTRRQINVGNYKEYPNSVRLSNGEIFDYPSPAETPILMQGLIDWYRAEEEHTHPVVLAAMLHYKFVRIHPFDDGNGRVARLLMNYVLLKNGLPPIIIKTEDKTNYLRALHLADVGDVEPFINYIAEQVIWSLELSLKAAKGETIDGTDTIDKEMAIWMRSLPEKTISGISKSNKEIYNLYEGSIQKLLLTYVNKYRLFDPVFDKIHFSGYLNDGVGTGYEYIDDILQKYGNSLDEKTDTINSDEHLDLNLWSIKLGVNLIGFKRNGKNIFTCFAEIQINFREYTWEISGTNIKKIVKLYRENLFEEEVTEAVKSAIEGTQEEINRNLKLDIKSTKDN